MKQTKLDAAIILVSEITKGMKSLGSKALLNIDEYTTIVDYQIHYLKKHYNPNKIILCTGFDNERIQQQTKKYKNIEYAFNANYNSENQSGSLIKCLSEHNIKNAFVITNGLILFNKIKLPLNSSTYFIESNYDKKQAFEIGTSNLNHDGYLFYDLDYKWIELLFLDELDIANIKELSIITNQSQLFLFELINNIRSLKNSIDFIKLENINYPIKVNSLKDITYAKKIYKKYFSVSNQS